MSKILIVDDDIDLVESIKLVLEKEGYQTLVAYSKADAEKAVENEKPDMLILDVMMEQPDDGIALAQGLRRKGISTPILMLTSISKVTGMDYGKDDSLVPVNDFYEKPIEPSVLIEKVQNLLKG